MTGIFDANCAPLLSPRHARPRRYQEVSTKVVVYGRELTLHVASTPGAHDRSSPLILYASGDGGWFGTAVGMYRTIAESGLSVVGFSTRAFMKYAQSAPPPVTTANVALGYRDIIDTARHQLQLSDDVPVVLTGWSRGASLAVLVAGSQHADTHIAGVVAIGLVAREHLDITPTTDDDDGPASSEERRNGEFDMYALIAHLAPRRCVVIQASRDGYLPAARARNLFGEESNIKRFIEIDARNHRFDHGEVAFADALRQALRWVSAPLFPESTCVEWESPCGGDRLHVS